MKTQLLRYYGGKNRIAPWIISHFPIHEAYIEPFCGGASVFFSKEPSPVEVINDLNDELMTFFRICREFPNELAQLIALTPLGRAEFENVWKPGVYSDLEIARRVAVKSWQGWGHRISQNDGWNKNFKRYRTGWDYLPDIVLLAAERLRSVHLESKDAVELINLYSKPQKRELHTRIFYIDPPYAEETLASRHRYGKYNIDHEQLLVKLLDNPFYVLISGYDSEMYNDLLKEWYVFEKEKIDFGQNRVKELLWINPLCYEKLQEEGKK